MKKIAVLMTCFNRVKTTLACLERLFAQKVPEGYSFDVWLVDDASPDKTGEKVKTAFPQVNVILSPGSLFWAKGMRLAWDKADEACDYDYFLWLNDDLMLYTTTIAAAIEDLANIGDEAVLVGACAQKEGLSELSYGVPSAKGRRIQPNGATPELTPMAGMNGNFVLIPKTVYKKVGKICGEFYHGMADWDYGHLLKENGVPKYCASHIVGVCPQQPERYLHSKGFSLKQRIHVLFSPKGLCVHDTYLFRRRHFGLLRAIISVVHVTCKALFALEK